MTRHGLFQTAILLSTLLLHANPGLDSDSDPGPARSGDVMDQLDNLTRYAMPGKAHELLQQMEGQWITRTRYRMNPSVDPVEAQGTSQRKWILEGRFLLEELDGGDLGLPFRGMGLYGFDAFEQKYTSAWVDTMNTAIMNNLGVYDTTNQLVRFVGLYKDPWTGLRKKNRGVTRFLGPDKQVLELHITEPDGTEYKMLEITYTRAGKDSNQ